MFFGSFFSCNYFEKKKLNSEMILIEELKTFKWNELDRTQPSKPVMTLLIFKKPKAVLSKRS
tara:strand:+ start:652 stop:837 length:186 start_codon:yes stop_codon:yes gene_type:complete